MRNVNRAIVRPFDPNKDHNRTASQEASSLKQLTPKRILTCQLEGDDGEMEVARNHLVVTLDHA